MRDSAANRPLLGLNAGAEYGLAKRWPEARFIEAAILLQQQLQCDWVIIGGAADRELAARIAAGIQAARPADMVATTIPVGVSQPHTPPAVWNLAGQTSLRELCAVLHRCRLLLTNDTGPMHVAAAVGTPVVVPFGSTSPELTGPGLPDDTTHRCLRVVTACAPCFQRVCPLDLRCMHGIRTAQVVAAVRELLS